LLALITLAFALRYFGFAAGAEEKSVSISGIAKLQDVYPYAGKNKA